MLDTPKKEVKRTVEPSATALFAQAEALEKEGNDELEQSNRKIKYAELNQDEEPKKARLTQDPDSDPDVDLDPLSTSSSSSTDSDIPLIDIGGIEIDFGVPGSPGSCPSALFSSSSGEPDINSSTSPVDMPTSTPTQ